MVATQAVEKRVCRSRDAYIGGVCAGLAEHFDLDPIVVRILAVLITIMTLGLGAIVYVVLWARLPLEDAAGVLYEITPESAESNAFGSVDCQTGRAVSKDRETDVDGATMLARLAVAVCLVLLFLIVAMNISPLVPGIEWWQFWPVGFLILGLCLIIIPIPTKHEAAWHALGIVLTSLSAMAVPMALGMLSWNTVPTALSQGWLLIAAAVALFIFGLYRDIDALPIVAAFFIVAFCLMALTLCATPGDVESLLFHMPDGSYLKISFVNSE